MAAQKGGTTPHILMECGEDIFNLHSDQVHPKAQKQAQLLSRGSLSSSKVACIFGALLLLVAATSVGALAVSLYALRISENRETLREWDDKQLSQLEEAERNALFQVESMMEGAGEMKFLHPHVPSGGVLEIDAGYQRDQPAERGSGPLQESDSQQERSTMPGYRNQRSVDGTNEDLCVSSNETGTKPLAHIVGPKTKARKRLSNGDRFTVLTENWECEGSDGGVRAMVQGGMIFNRSSGFLELPVGGVYYIYHQVTFKPPRSGERLARSRLVACIPNEDCSYIMEDNDPYMQTETNLEGRYGTSNFQAGMFRFPVGSQIAILVWNELYNSPHLDAIRYDDTGYNTYMGGYLVDQENV